VRAPASDGTPASVRVEVRTASGSAVQFELVNAGE